MAMFKLHDLPQEYLEYMVDIMHKEGHHYFYHDDAQYNDEQVVIGPDQLFVGFTIRLFLYNKDQSGYAKLATEWKSSVGQTWHLVTEFRDKSIWYAGRRRFTIRDDSKSVGTLPDDSVYTLSIRVLTDKVFQALLNEQPFYQIDVEDTVNYRWTFRIKVQGQILLGMSTTSDTVARTDDLWGRQCCLRNLWMPVGTIGVYTCALVDNTQETYHTRRRRIYSLHSHVSRVPVISKI
ncbi:uncharacterized protein [Dermacentor andersoni]|uniref:uncharacterized protein isoform X2 n=1 Tax=Dermacentor andersoni TaxID=34620 RepID=UPI002416C281|nr:uncharacterized protein LOC126519816 isoform X2 [Dermacentor andersoni]